MSKLKVAVLFGGKTCEHDVSIISGIQALNALDTSKYDAFPVYLDRDGAWFIGDALRNINFYRNFQRVYADHVLPSGENGKLVLRAWPGEKKVFFAKNCDKLAEADVVVPVMHGLNGEDGTLQGMLEMFGVPYTSAGVLGCALGMDKIAMKTYFRGCGFPVLESEWLDRAEWAADREKVMDRLEKKLPYPMYVKPANLGSSIGISRAKDRASLAEALDVAAAYDRRILVERGVKNRLEVNCSVLGYAGYVRASVLEMPEQVMDGILDFATKYLKNAHQGGSKGMTSLARQIPAPIGDELTEKIRDLSVRVFREMDMKGVVRIDYIIDADTNEFYICEANTIPGSLSFYLWEPMGLPYAKMLDEMIVYAQRDRAEREASRFSYDSTILNQQGGGSKGGKLGGGKLGGMPSGAKFGGGKLGASFPGGTKR